MTLIKIVLFAKKKRKYKLLLENFAENETKLGRNGVSAVVRVCSITAVQTVVPPNITILAAG